MRKLKVVTPLTGEPSQTITETARGLSPLGSASGTRTVSSSAALAVVRPGVRAIAAIRSATSSDAERAVAFGG